MSHENKTVENEWAIIGVVEKESTTMVLRGQRNPTLVSGFLKVHCSASLAMDI